MRPLLVFCSLFLVSLFATTASAQITESSYQSKYLNNYLEGTSQPTSIIIQKSKIAMAPELQLERGPSITINKYHVHIYNLVFGKSVDLNRTIPRTPHEELLNIRNANLVYKLPTQFGVPRSSRNALGSFFIDAIF